MSNYIHFTEEQKECARQTDITEFLRLQGQKIKPSGSEYEWKDGTQKVTIRGNLWYHQYEQKGGDAIDFVRRFYNKSYPEAMECLLDKREEILITSPPAQKQRKPFTLPPQNENMRRVYAYLINHRGIDRNVLYTFANKGMIYESADFHNAVFVGFDNAGIPRHAHKRGSGSQSTYKGNQNGSQPEYSFHWNGAGESLYLFEAPIDLLSFISIHQEKWKQQNYAASCSVSDRVLFQCLQDNIKIKKVYLCFDSDEPGQKAAERIRNKLCTQEINSEILVPIHKDWNEDLLIKKDSEAKEICQVLQL